MADTATPKYAFFGGEIVPFDQAKVSVMTHAFNYGTGVFEGIRGYWNGEAETTYIVKLREHFLRFLKNCKMMHITVPYSVDELMDVSVQLVEMQDMRGDVYLRPIAYKSSETIGVSMEGVADALTIFASTFGNYVDIDRGLSVCVSSWRRTEDNAIPARAKVTGNYVNSALAKNEAVVNGYDEAIVLNPQGFVAEASAANIFIVRGRTLITPGFSDDILEGLTRDIVTQLAKDELGLETRERSIARSELYYADEIFFAGTGVQIASVTSVDHRNIGNGEVGPITGALQRLYFDAVKGRNPKYMEWLTPVKSHALAGSETLAAS
ncbi:MAG TPA: branched-chain amino acid transaminase [Chloroflexota bacterium]|nr:branched-chain amino acid transaminase [Chloroflexota bacterium]